MLGVVIILLFTVLGSALERFIGIPGVLTGLVLLALSLWTGIIKEEWLLGSGSFFLKHLTLFFLPAALGIIDYFDLLAQELFSILLVVTLSTALTIVVTGWVAQWAGGGKND